MNKLSRFRLSWCLFCAGALMLNTNASSNENKQSPAVKALVEESTKRKAVQESTLLNKNPFVHNDVREALRYINKHTDYTAYHLLLALRKYYPESYKTIPDDHKVAVLCSAMKNLTYLNDWGYLERSESYDGESAKALIETGTPALKLLVSILDDGRKAPLFGSQAATLSSYYKYRRKDFGARYVSLILGQNPPIIYKNPTERDKEIDTLKRQLSKEK